MTAISTPRWLAKKAARQAMSMAIGATGALQMRRALAQAPRIRVITYHRFGDIARDPFCITRRDFEAQIRFLAEEKRAIGLDDLARFVSGEQTLVNDAVLVTIDDGFLSTLTEALPVLRHHAVPAVAFVTPSLIDVPDAPRTEVERYMTWDELSRLAEAGIATGGHGFAHESFGGFDFARAKDQAVRAREMLESRLGTKVCSFAYPFGTLRDFSPETRRALGEAGYALVFTAQHGSVCKGMDAHELPRVKVENGDGQRFFERLCDGAMDAWRVVDTGLTRLQRPTLGMAPRD